MHLNYIILDKNISANEQLGSLLEKNNNWQAQSNEGLTNDLNSLIHDPVYDVIFLSPNYDGFDWTKFDCNNANALIVLLSNSTDSASEAYQKGVFNFLTQPIKIEEIEQLIKRIEQLLIKDISNEKVNVEPFIFVKSDYKIIRIKINEIQFIESMREYVRIHTIDQKIITLLSLSRLEEILPKRSFMRVHRSTIVNIDKINFIQGNVISIGNDQISISKSQKDSIMEYVSKYGLF